MALFVHFEDVAPVGVAPMMGGVAAAAPEVSQIVTTREIAQAAGPIGDGAKVVSK